MEIRANVAFRCGVAALLAVLALPSGLSAQVEAFNAPALPAGWMARQSPVVTGDLWAVDASPTDTPSSPISASFPITPFASPPFSLNFNNGGGNVSTGLSTPTNSGILTPIFDLTFAPLTPGPKLRFNQMQHRWYTFPTDYHICEVVVWDSTLSTVIAIFNVSCNQNPGVNFCNWGLPAAPTVPVPTELALQSQWGSVRFEFRYHSNFSAPIQDQGSAGWFIDDVEVANLNPPAFAIIQSPLLPGVAVGTPINIQFTTANNVGALNNWRVLQGSIPAGTTLNANSGLLSGSPTDSGNYSFQVAVDDSAVPIPGVAVKWFSLAVTRAASFVYPVFGLPFDDDFATDKGWVFISDNPPGIPVTGPGPSPYSDVSEGGWERGSTFQSPQGQWVQDNKDPASDRTMPGTDNMVLGVRVGARWNDTQGLVANRKYWAFTPEIDVGGMRYIDVKFYRWLNAHSTEVPSRVEIWNPSTLAWQQIWAAAGASDDHDSAWQQVSISHDFGAVPPGSATTRVRFGWWATPTSVGGTTYGSGGFNIDDVQVIEKPQPGILLIQQAKVFSTTGPVSAPFTWVGQQYPLILQVNNTSTVPIEVTSFTYDFYSMLGGNATPENQVGQFIFSQTPSVATPWLIPPGSNFFICNVPTSPGPVVGEFDCLAIASTGNGGTVFFHCVLLGKETTAAVGQTQPRSTVSDSVVDLPSGNTKVSPSAPPPVEINSPLTLPAANLGQPYIFNFSAHKGVPPYHSWNMTAGPTWITFDPVNARITGTPPAQQVYQLTVEVFDSTLPTNTTDSKTFTINVVNVGPLPIQISTSSQLPNATEVQPYAPLVFNASGGTPPYNWAMVGGTLPAGMTFTPAQATLAGTPGAGTTGAYTFQIRAGDSSNPVTSVTRTFFLSVLPANAQVAITTPSVGPGRPPDGLETEPYNGGVPFQFAAAGGFVSGPNSYRWTIIGGTWPPGLVLDPVTGRVSGTPTQQGQFGFQLRVTDGAFPPSTNDASFTVEIDPLVPVPMFISSKAILTPAHESNPYLVQLAATYGKAPLTWRLKTGSVLPAGLVLNTVVGDVSGVITSGQAASPSQDFLFTIEVLDSSSPQQLAEKEFTLNVSAFVNGVLTILTPELLPEGGVEFAYSTWLRGTGGSPVDPANPYQWAISPGSSLPVGLTLGLNGHISGIVPLLLDDTYTFTIELNDGGGNTTSRLFTLQINDYQKPPEPPTVEIVAGRERIETVPFWEACSVGAGAGATGFVAFAAMAAFASVRRRRES